MSCGNLIPKQKTLDKPKSIEWGKQGEQPTEVWKNYDWFCADSTEWKPR